MRKASVRFLLCVFILQVHVMTSVDSHSRLGGVAQIVAQIEAYMARAMWDIRVGSWAETTVALMRSRDLVEELKNQLQRVALDVSHLHMDSRFAHLYTQLEDAIMLVSQGKGNLATIFRLLDIFKKLEVSMARAGLVAPVRGWYM